MENAIDSRLQIAESAIYANHVITVAPPLERGRLRKIAVLFFELISLISLVIARSAIIVVDS